MGWILYNLQMTDLERYRYYLADCRKEKPHLVTRLADVVFSCDKIKNEIIKADLENYRKHGANNSVKLGFRLGYSASGIASFKRQIFAVISALVCLYYGGFLDPENV